MKSSITLWIGRMESQIGRRFRFGSIMSDPYIAGILAAKLKVVDFLLETRVGLSNKTADEVYSPGERRRLFMMGVKEADQFDWVDLAWELYGMHKRSGPMFEPVIVKCVGHEQYEEIRWAIKTARPPRPLKGILRWLRSRT